MHGEFCKLHSYRMRGVEFYQNHVENAGEPHSPSRRYVEKKTRKFYKRVLAELVKVRSNE